MKRIFSGGLFIAITGILLFSFSCAPQACLENTEAYLKASFFDSAAKKLSPPAKLTLSGLNNDSIIYSNTARIQPALIPLNNKTDSSVFVITINGVSDTVKFLYSSYPHLISKECGYTFYHRIDTSNAKSRTTYHKIRKILYTNPSITTVNEENIRIFY
jgi:hypothetical protein